MKKDMQFWAAHVAAIQCEGIFVSAYAKRENLSLASLYYWQRKLGAAAAPDAAAPVPESRFMQLRVGERGASRSGSACTLELAGGVRLELAELPSAEWLANLARAAAGAF
ncbi:hypothetical protein F2P44_33505 [Massilia sp. CCM 8695]|uniref:Transposase n=2 Tax=Massilia TaxID=149698 RepID=A0ABX0MWV3_9BURK|nr:MULTISPECIES: hypothetical protein [Massilia]NHZ67170.1 hypothetical protein [Massilia genomosp. 1]NHZ84135.1 hypothetical protein [Massilia frigida]